MSGCESLKSLIAIYETIETNTQSVINSIQTTIDTYGLDLFTTYPTIFNTITEYKTIFTNKLASYKTKKEGYQQEYNGDCVTTTTITSPTTTTTTATTTTTTTTTTATKSCNYNLVNLTKS